MLRSTQYWSIAALALGLVVHPTDAQAQTVGWYVGELQPVTAPVQLGIRRPRTVAEGGDPSGASQLIDDPAIVAKLRGAMEQRRKNSLSGDELDAALGEGAARLNASLPHDSADH